jgi:hypothetical protein
MGHGSEPAPAPPAASEDAPRLPDAPRAASAPSLAARDPAPDLAAEIALLDRAREALAAGEPARALAVLERYDREMPAGRLAPEAAYVRIEALLAAGDRAGADAAGRRFLAANPTSPHAKRVRALLQIRDPSNP